MPDSSEIGDAIGTIQRNGWELTFAADGSVSSDLRESVVAIALGTSAGTAGLPVRRSAHADTWLAKLRNQDLFIKIIRPRRGLKWLRRQVRGGAAAHVAAITAALQRDGFQAAAPMLWGSEQRGGREIIVTARARG